MVGWQTPVNASDEDEENYREMVFCMKGRETHAGHLFRQEGRSGYSVATASFHKDRAQEVAMRCIGLDSKSTVNIFAEKRMLKNVRFIDETKYIACNAGTVVVRQKGGLPGYGPVWYHEKAIANILSLNNVQKRFRVTFDSVGGNQFAVHRDEGSTRVFRPTGQGLYTSQAIQDAGSRSGVTMSTA